MRLADSHSATLSVLATAMPPLALISSTTFCAGPASLAFALDRGAEVVDHDFRAGGRHGEREIAADAAAGAGDDDDFAF